MSTRPRRLAVYALAVACALATPALGGCSPDDERVSTSPVVAPGRPGEEATVLPPGTTFAPPAREWNAADVAFIGGMIPHHEQAVAMAQLAPGRASDPTVTGLASRIEDVQGPEIDVYRRWLDERGLDAAGQDASHGSGHGSGHGPAGPGTDRTHPGMATAEELDRLEDASGERFDRLWLELMIRHHEGALEMVDQHAADGGRDTRAAELAADVAVTQLDEIARMQRLLDQR